MSTHATQWPKQGPSAAQLKEFFAQIDSGRITSAKLQAIITNKVYYGERHRAQEIMGGDIVFPDEVKNAFGEPFFADSHMEHYERTIPNTRELEALRGKYYLIPCPVGTHGPWALHHVFKAADWKPPRHEDHFTISGCIRGSTFLDWLAVPKELPYSKRSCTWSDWEREIEGSETAHNESIPFAAEVAWATYVLRKTRRVNHDGLIPTRSSWVKNGRVTVQWRRDHWPSFMENLPAKISLADLCPMLIKYYPQRG